LFLLDIETNASMLTDKQTKSLYFMYRHILSDPGNKHST